MAGQEALQGDIAKKAYKCLSLISDGYNERDRVKVLTSIVLLAEALPPDTSYSDGVAAALADAIAVLISITAGSKVGWAKLRVPLKKLSTTSRNRIERRATYNSGQPPKLTVLTPEDGLEID